MIEILQHLYNGLIYGDVWERVLSIALMVSNLILFFLLFILLVVLYQYIDEKVNVTVKQCEEKHGAVASYKAGYTDINLIDIGGTLTPIPIDHSAKIVVNVDGKTYKINVNDKYKTGDEVQVLIKTRYRKGAYYDTVVDLA